MGRRIRYFISGKWLEGWTGPVVRLADLTDDERRAIGARTHAEAARIRSEIQTWLCYSCRTWTYNGAYKTGRCNLCHHPRPAD